MIISNEIHHKILKEDRKLEVSIKETGYISRYMNKVVYEQLDTSSIAHMHHKPYQNDWTEAMQKAQTIKGGHQND